VRNSCLSLTSDNLRQPGWGEAITVPVGLHDVWDARAEYMAQFGMPEPLQRQPGEFEKRTQSGLLIISQSAFYGACEKGEWFTISGPDG
jgi:hypothetical protein